MFNDFTKEDLLEVTWVDIVAWSGWLKVADEKNVPSKCVTYGFPVEVLMSNEKQAVILSATVSGANGHSEFNQHITIPVDCIIAVRKINKE